MIHSYSSYNHTARVMLAVLLLTSAAGISVQAESIGGDNKDNAADGGQAGANSNR